MQLLNKKDTVLPILVLVGIGLAACLLTFALYPKLREVDSRSYILPAKSLIERHEFSGFGRTPGYPLFLAFIYLFSDSDIVVVWVQKVMLILVAVSLYWHFHKDFGRNIAWGAAALLLLDIPTQINTNLLLSEALFLLVLTMSFFLVRYAKNSGKLIPLWAAGVLAGFLVLIRPIALLVFGVFTVYLMFRRPFHRRWFLAIGLFVAVANLAPALWLFRQHSQTGIWAFSYVPMGNLLYWKASPVLAWSSGRTIDETEKMLRGEVEAREKSLQKKLGRPLNPMERGKIEENIGKEIILTHPLTALRVSVWGFGRIFLGVGYQDYITRFGSRAKALIHIFQYALTGSMFTLFLIGVIRELRRRRWEITGLCLGLIIVLILPAWGMDGSSRFRVAFIPFYTLYIVVGFSSLITFLNKFNFFHGKKTHAKQ